MNRRYRAPLGALILLVILGALGRARGPVEAQAPTPTVVDPNLLVRTIASGLVEPIHLAFLGGNEAFVLEKGRGRVLRGSPGTTPTAVLDLPVNSAQERGLLSIALHPDFPADPGVYLFWTESQSGVDSTAVADVPLLGNRVDRFAWDGTSLVFERNLIHLRARQADAGQPEFGNHNGGVMRFGPDGKLYVQVGDVGRRGQMQNLEDGPFGPGIPDDQFGGPEPDDAHLTGVILRLNDDGTAPADNPFFDHGTQVGGEVGANLQKVFAYGIRNGFGMAFDPVSGDLWEQENGDDSFSELNRVAPGMNSGWVQIMGPAGRVAQYKAIETSTRYFGLQQIRWPPGNIANTPEEAGARLFALPGAHFSAPEFSWKYEVAPGGIGFVEGTRLGAEYDGDLVMGGATPVLRGGHLFRFDLTADRTRVAVTDARINDRVADNTAKYDITESESLLFGENFGSIVDVKTGPNGNLFLVSIDHGAIYMIRRR